MTTDIHLPNGEQAHDPPEFPFGQLSVTKMGWLTTEKEAYAALTMDERLH